MRKSVTRLSARIPIHLFGIDRDLEKGRSAPYAQGRSMWAVQSAAGADCSPASLPRSFLASSHSLPFAFSRRTAPARPRS